MALNVTTSRARATHTVSSQDIERVLCHRQKDGEDQFLVRWSRLPAAAPPRYAICSWHSIPELRRGLHHVQAYIENFEQAEPVSKTFAVNDNNLLPTNRKRKASQDGDLRPRDLFSSGLLSPGQSASRSTSANSISSNLRTNVVGVESDPSVYNGELRKKEGRLIARPSNASHVVQIDASKLPTLSMTQNAARTKLEYAKRAIREEFVNRLKPVRGVRLENMIDETTPSLDFTFIPSYILGEGIYQAPPETFEGCQKCKPNMGQNIGCEYPSRCECLEFAAVNENELQKRPDDWEEYQRQKEAGESIDTSGLPKRFPYTKPDQKNPLRPCTLVTYYRESRHPIYECNLNCMCGPRCKSRLVQRDRRVPLAIVRTANRGWGVQCDEDLLAGEFIDTYLGEVITNEEAGRRESSGGVEKNSYLYSLDKFVGDSPELTEETCYVVDGQHKGGPSRFINHSCEPNIRQFTVSYNKHDLLIYDIAFFALENIPAGTELTFDYMDLDEVEVDEAQRIRHEALNDPANHGKVRCNCGTEKCRGYLWS